MRWLLSGESCRMDRAKGNITLNSLKENHRGEGIEPQPQSTSPRGRTSLLAPSILIRRENAENNASRQKSGVPKVSYWCILCIEEFHS